MKLTDKLNINTKTNHLANVIETVNCNTFCTWGLSDKVSLVRKDNFFTAGVHPLA